MEIKTMEYFERIKGRTFNADKLSEEGNDGLLFLLPCNEPVEYETEVSIIKKDDDIIERIKNQLSFRRLDSKTYYALNVKILTKHDNEIKQFHELTFSRYAYKKGNALIWLKYVIKKKILKDEVIGIRLGMRENVNGNSDWKYFIVMKKF